jgi:FMN phosphatase YigB (HAD superfamily)
MTDVNIDFVLSYLMVILDYDDTIISRKLQRQKTHTQIAIKTQQAYPHHFIKALESDDLDKSIALGYGPHRIAEIIGCHCNESQEFFARQLKGQHHGYSTISCPLGKGVKKTLKRLSQNCLVVVVSMNDPLTIQREMKQHGIRDLIDKVYAAPARQGVCSRENALELKEANFKLIQRFYNLDSSDILVIGDGGVELEVAKSLNMDAIGLLSGTNDYEALKRHNPMFIAADLHSAVKRIMAQEIGDKRA